MRTEQKEKAEQEQMKKREEKADKGREMKGKKQKQAEEQREQAETTTGANAMMIADDKMKETGTERRTRRGT